jgi:guanosine-3',5'-bis(diphosphate) 3'-pyrophosphohydrolase
MDSDDLLSRLPEAVRIFNGEEREKIARALRLAESVHQGQTRDEGTPYIAHPIAVARILMKEIDITEAGVNPLDAVCAALLHDVLEHSELTAEELERDFGPEVARVVSAVTMTKDPAVPQEVWGVAYMTRLMTSDKIVRLVKIADRLHNTRTLHLASPQKRRRYWQETAEWYLPLAEITDSYLYETLLELCTWHRREMGIGEE